MNPTLQLAVATAAFLGAHFVSSTPLRAALAGRVGERGYLGLYSLVSFATLGWMIWAFVRAPAEPLIRLKLLPTPKSWPLMMTCEISVRTSPPTSTR